MFKQKVLMLLVAVTLLFSGVLVAQEQTGEVIGTVVLEDGSAIPGVAVEAKGSNLVGKRTTVTNETGSFRFMALPGGVYEFTFVLEGFKTVKRKEVKVEVGRTYKLDIVMETGAIQKEIVVTGESPVIDVRKSATAVNISKEVFKKLPKGRDFQSIITTSAGVNAESEFDNGDGQSYSFDGASASENTYYVDGVDTTTLFTGTSGTSVNFDFIEEVQVKSSGYAAEYGGSMGGVISVITRSGGNEFHGQLVTYFDGSALGYDPRPTLRINPLNENEAEYITYDEDSWTRIEPGFGLGGYIIKDRLWFFGSFMPKFRTRTRDAVFIGHEEHNAEYEQKQTTYAGSLKLTGQLANNLRATLHGTLDYYKYEGDLPALDGSGNYARDYAASGYKYPKFTVGGALDYTVGNNLMLNASLGFFRQNTKQDVGPAGAFIYMPYTNANIPGVPADLVRPKYWTNQGYSDSFQTTKDIESKLTGTFDFTYYTNMGGEHVFKAGVQMVKLNVDTFDAMPYDYYRYYWGLDYEHSDGVTRDTTYGYLHIREPFGTVAETSSTRWAIYAQDSWTIGDKLTLNLGVRLEKEDIPAFAEGYDPPIQFDFFDKFAPRVGFAYDVFGDSSLKLFGSFGIYYDVMKLEMAEGSYGGFKWWSHYYDIATLDWTTYGEYDHPVTTGLNGGEYYESRNWRVVSFDTTQPDMKPFQKNEYTFGIQKTLNEDWSVSLRFLHNNIVNAIEDIGVKVGGHEEYFNGNPGSDWIQEKYKEAIAEGNIPAGVEATEAVRDYTSVTINLDRKFKNNWLGGLSYTWSSLHGNFAGLASSDEHGRKSPGVERYFDAWFLTLDQNGNQVLGPLMTDRPHQFKAYGAYSFDWGLTLGFNGFAMVGTPTQTELLLNDQQGYYPLGRNSNGRTPFLWQIDAYAEYNLKLSDKYTLQLSVNVTNLTDNDIAQRLNMRYNSANVTIPEQEIKDGFNYLDVVAQKGAQLNPRYKMEYSFLSSIAARLGVKFLF